MLERLRILRDTLLGKESAIQVSDIGVSAGAIALVIYGLQMRCGLLLAATPLVLAHIEARVAIDLGRW